MDRSRFPAGPMETTESILAGRVDAFRASTRFAPTFGVTMDQV
jgi:hypothetical protein